MEPPKKQPKIENGDIKEMLMTMQFSFINKLKNIEGKIEKLSSKYFLLEQKVESILLKAQDPTLKTPQSNVPCSSSNTSCISANDEEAYPEGSWLGDPNNRELRVRCNISPTDLELINNSCPTPEKMALLLLDYLFDREIQAKSNISGTGKHGKQQLDPLKIYGIKCHITYMFGISNKDWQRIKQNIDSKCRTAFQRKQKGMPLVVKGCRERYK
ncbi:protein BANP-like isoform X1 [Stegodyphus dumicola]|uniref:protein BANP-like isoform X1 n=1 Tax=Stegodyphus dumicola TaxID=202533 RepID=UPI0015B1FBE9|nr:protein BANP-like isoform X1 [Stegodyphus dumicola]XP_035209017.1 protein BANP-like isoform X1 [Stegodyphus dumicola]XP_035209018.1 protein BANP-like isoform X1 [Stegodyphus dumicola]XP_035209019.1 protein BANP-like isoform X1 [Stegodyphus dumicola]